MKTINLDMECLENPTCREKKRASQFSSLSSCSLFSRSTTVPSSFGTSNLLDSRAFRYATLVLAGSRWWITENGPLPGMNSRRIVALILSVVNVNEPGMNILASTMARPVILLDNMLVSFAARAVSSRRLFAFLPLTRAGGILLFLWELPDSWVIERDSWGSLFIAIEGSLEVILSLAISINIKFRKLCIEIWGRLRRNLMILRWGDGARMVSIYMLVQRSNRRKKIGGFTRRVIKKNKDEWTMTQKEKDTKKSLTTQHADVNDREKKRHKEIIDKTARRCGRTWTWNLNR